MAATLPLPLAGQRRFFSRYTNFLPPDASGRHSGCIPGNGAVWQEGEYPVWQGGESPSARVNIGIGARSSDMLIDVTRPENKSAQGEVDDGSRSVGPFWQGSHNIIAGISKPVMPGTPVARSTRSATPHRPHQSTLHHGNVFTLVTDRDRVTDHPRNASYFSKQSTFTTLPNLVTTGGLCVTHKKRVLCAGAPSGCKVLSISTEERSLSSISLPPPPMSTASS